MPRQEQEEIGLTGPGVERKKIKALEDAIYDWNAAKEKRMKLAESEAEKKSVVLALMEKHAVNLYRYEDDREVVLIENVKVRKVELDGATDED